jgi:hypothetical protein
MTTLAPAMGNGGQERQINLILIIQIDFSRLRLPLQLFDPTPFVVIVGIRAGNGQDWPKQFIAMSMQVMANPTHQGRQIGI